MTDTTESFSNWLAQAQLSVARLTPSQQEVLQAAFRFRQRQGDDYYSTRLLSHFLLHCDCGLKVAQVARLLGLSRPTASRQQGLSSKEAIRQAHHRMDGRPYGKLLPRYAGPVAQFLFTHPDASRSDLIDFIDQTFGVRVSRVALGKFLKKFGLVAAASIEQFPCAASPASVSPADVSPADVSPADVSPADVSSADAFPADTSSAEAPSLRIETSVPGVVLPGPPVPAPAPPFSSRRRTTRVPSC